MKKMIYMVSKIDRERKNNYSTDLRKRHSILLNPIYITMGNWFAAIPEKKMIVLGLDGSGKTTIMYKLSPEVPTTIPGIGTVEETYNVKSKNCHLRFLVCDVPGSERVRGLWRHYLQGTAGIIYVVDSADVGRLEEAGLALLGFINEENIHSLPILIFANKQDLPGALQEDEVATRMNCAQLKNPWKIWQSTASSGDGLCEGFDWLAEIINDPNGYVPTNQLHSTIKSANKV